MNIEQLKTMVDNAPEDATHVCFENGTHYQFKIKGLSAEIHGENGWISYEGCALPDLDNVSLLSDIKNIVELVEATLNPTAVDFVRCGIGANYSGEYYENMRSKVHQPIANLYRKYHA